MRFLDILKYAFWILLILSIAPTLLDSINKQYGSYLELHSKVALVTIQGVLSNSENYIKQLITYFHDPAIKAIIIMMDCPGSAAGTAQAIFNEIKTLKKNCPKPIVTLVENLCASGGYYIACATDYIIAPPSALIGSIGTTLSPIFSVKEFIEQFHIPIETLKAGDFKLTGDPFTAPLNAQERQFLQTIIDDAYHQFAEHVAQQRHLSLDGLNEWANGKIFTARQAQEKGLINEIGSFCNALCYVKEKGFIEGKIEWVRKPKPSFWSTLFGQEDETELGFMNYCIHQLLTVLEKRYALNCRY